MRIQCLAASSRRAATGAAGVISLALAVAGAGLAGAAVADASGTPARGSGPARIVAKFTFGEGFASDVEQVAPLTGGGALVVGSGSADRRAVGLARLDGGGRPVASFGDGGRALVTLPVSEVSVRGLRVLGDRGIVVTGTLIRTAPAAGQEPDYDAFVLRLGSDGAPAAGFGDRGLLVLRTSSTAGAFEQVVAAVALPDGRLLLAGDDDAGTFTARVGADGALDPSYGSGGVARPFPAVPNLSAELALDAGGGLTELVGARVRSGSVDADFDTRNFDWTVARVLADGAPAGTFGRAGLVSIPMGDERSEPDFDFVRAAARTRAGLTMLGSIDEQQRRRAAAAAVRLTPRQAIDRRFGRRGRWSAPIPGLEQVAGAVTAGGAAWIAGSDGRRTRVWYLSSAGRAVGRRLTVDVDRRRHEIVRGLAIARDRGALLVIVRGNEPLFEGTVVVAKVRRPRR